jgi:acyl carrier protein
MVAKRIGKSPETIELEDELLADLGLDSLALAELSAEAEEMSGDLISAEELFELSTVGSLVRLLSRAIGAAE